MRKKDSSYVVTFGNYNYETKHVFNKRTDAVAKAKELKLKLPGIKHIKVKKRRKK
jgi:hypothetical protein